MATDRKTNILVTGANGQLGSELRVLASNYLEFNFIFADRDDFSFENEKEILDFFNSNKPEIVINCAAYTAVDKAESEE